ncbi:hypothetical protein ACS0TY_012100 [Phlomoides rotata]
MLIRSSNSLKFSYVGQGPLKDPSSSHPQSQHFEIYTTIIYSESRTILRHLIYKKLNLSPPKNWSNQFLQHKLLLNPDKLEKLKQELMSVVGEKRQIEESDAVIKEVFRYHPAVPFLVPRAAGSDYQVNGYLIPKGTQILTNVWAIGRDPSIWENPESFVPEQLLNKRTDFKGLDFELIPFGRVEEYAREFLWQTRSCT